MKTQQPLILTARLAEDDMEPFNRLRQAHFPPDRNFLRAHMTMFHRLPGEYVDSIKDQLTEVTREKSMFTAQVAGIRHLGAGVAFSIASPDLFAIRERLKSAFSSWLGGQDMQKWQPHITVQNKVSKTAADALYKELQREFTLTEVRIVGLDLWHYLGGPWQQAFFFEFEKTR